jgi:hypothetical protein
MQRAGTRRKRWGERGGLSGRSLLKAGRPKTAGTTLGIIHGTRLAWGFVVLGGLLSWIARELFSGRGKDRLGILVRPITVRRDAKPPRPAPELAQGDVATYQVLGLRFEQWRLPLLAYGTELAVATGMENTARGRGCRTGDLAIELDAVVRSTLDGGHG